MNRFIIVILVCANTMSANNKVNCQGQGSLPPFTKWYQDPLGVKPLELSSAFGFLWGAAGVTACLVFTHKDSGTQKGISVYQEAGLSVGYKPPYTTVIHNEAGLIYNVRNWMALGMGWNIFRFSDRTNNTFSFGFRPFARWYPYRTEKASLFFEYGAGISYSLDRFPLSGTGWKTDTARTGTRFNFITKYGIGTEIKMAERFLLHAGVRHFHLSNGNIEGIKRNPSHDSNGFFAGLIYHLRP